MPRVYRRRRSNFRTLRAQIDTPRPFLERIGEAEKERQLLLAQISDAETEQRAAEVLRAISAADVRRILSDLAQQLESADREGLKGFLAGLMERIELSLDGEECVIHYQIATGDKVASPRGLCRLALG